MTTPAHSMQRRRFLLALGLATVAATAPALAVTTAAKSRTPAQEIDLLIQRVGASKGVIFIRNGTDYTSADAARHLRRKLGAAGDKIQTPEVFIEELGSKSSMSGRAYRVRLPDGREMDSAVWLNGLLREIRAGR
jgi:hypothetical protein